MAYYDALIAKWATLTPGTTAQKLAQLNAITITGSVPTTFYCTGVDLLNCVNYPEFKVLTAVQQSNLLSMCSCPGLILGGSANTTHMAAGLILDYFPAPASPTIAALTALAKGVTQPWWQASVAAGGGALNGPVSLTDLTPNGLS